MTLPVLAPAPAPTRFLVKVYGLLTTEIYDLSFLKPFFEEFRFYSKPPGAELAPYEIFCEASQGENIDVLLPDTGFADHENGLKVFKDAFINDQIKCWILPRGPLSSNKHHEALAVGEALDDADSNKTVHTPRKAFHGTRVIPEVIDDHAGYP
ncbi:hypothetical protein TWF694_005227 [Orbilia ellipsospora]|uniref:Uncharacterized protein n=1 Tax=Orbilia ellipsospora TaxID=2528407 RepID=A0AAV9WXH7_9PEZI